MINNDLYNAFKALIIKLYKAVMDDNPKRPGIIPSKYFESKKAVALKWEEYNACIGIINSDVKIKELYNEILDDEIYDCCFRNAFDVVFLFISKYYEENFLFNEEVFESYYFNFETFLYDRISYHIYNVRLYNFINNTHRDIVISETLTLRYEPLESDNRYLNESAKYVIEYVVEAKWSIQKSEKVSIYDALKKATVFLDNFIKAIRLLKKTNIYRDEQVFHQTTNPAWPLRVVFNNIRQKTSMDGIDTELTDLEHEELNMFLNYINQERKTKEEKKNFKRFNVALSRLHYGVERDNFEDKVIDFMIGLEALYLPDGNSELTFRLSLRASLLLNTKASAKDDFKFLRKMYDARSSIVHGNISNISEEEIDKLEEITRKSLKAWLQNESLFTLENLNEVFFK